MRKVLVLGAGIYQVPLVKTAKRMGLYTIVASIPGAYPGFACADKAYAIDTTDQTAILRLARKEKIDAIVTCGTDVAIRTIGTVCEELGLTGVNSACSRLCTDKAEMKTALERAGVRTAPFCRVTDQRQALEAAEHLGWPVMLKAPDSSGSRGISCVKGPKEIKQAFKYAKEHSHGGHILVERYLSGHEIGVDGCICGGKIQIWPHDKLTYFNGFTNVPVGHVIPFDLAPEQRKDLEHQIVGAVHALGIERSFFNVDVMLTTEGANIIEVGARIGATCIPELISAVSGFDCYEAILRYALGEEPVVPDTVEGAAAAQLICAPREGRFAAVKGLPDSGNIAWMLDVQPGEVIHPFRVGPDRIGQILVCASSAQAARRKLKKAIHTLEIVYQ